MALYVKTGKYTGTGSGSITVNLSFTPKAFFIWSPAHLTSITTRSRVKLDVHEANDSSSNFGADFTDGNITFSGNNISLSGLSTDGMNISAKNYYWMALGGTDIVTGSYTGDDLDNRNITGLGIDPDFVNCFGGSANRFKTTSTGKTTDTSLIFNNLAGGNNRIQQLITDGFQVGTSINTLSTKYYYLAIQKSVVSGVFNEGKYTGNSSNNRDITGVGFNPSVIIVKGDSSAVSRIKSLEITDSSSSLGNGNESSNTIQQLIADGFRVSSSSTVNGNGTTYYWLAFKENEPINNHVNTRSKLIRM